MRLFDCGCSQPVYSVLCHNSAHLSQRHSPGEKLVLCRGLAARTLLLIRIAQLRLSSLSFPFCSSVKGVALLDKLYAKQAPCAVPASGLMATVAHFHGFRLIYLYLTLLRRLETLPADTCRRSRLLRNHCTARLLQCRLCELDRTVGPRGAWGTTSRCSLCGEVNARCLCIGTDVIDHDGAGAAG
jgi:hypothetical protein